MGWIGVDGRGGAAGRVLGVCLSVVGEHTPSAPAEGGVGGIHRLPNWREGRCEHRHFTAKPSWLLLTHYLR